MQVRNTYKGLDGKLEGKRPLGRSTRIYRWKENIKRDQEIWCGLDSSVSRYGPVAGSCEHGNDPSGYVKRRKFLDKEATASFSRKI
jgi:hypothetical protein